MKKQNIDKTGLKQTFLGFSLALVVMFVAITGFLFFQTINYNEVDTPTLQDSIQNLKQEKNTTKSKINMPKIQVKQLMI